jgi:hypothetical protein
MEKRHTMVRKHKSIVAIYYLLICILIINIFLQNYNPFSGYNIADNIAMADRYIISNLFKYSNGEHDFYIGSPNYFPFNAMLTIALIKILPNINIVYTIHFISSLFVVSYFFLLAREVKEKTCHNTLTIFTYSGIFVLLFFQPWLWYALDFKPDTLLLILFFILTKNLRKRNLFNYLLIFLLNLFCCLLKQQYLILFFGLFINLYFSSGNNKFIFFVLFSSSALAVLILFFTPNLMDFTISLQSERKFQSVLSISNLFYTFLLGSWPVLFILLFHIKKKWQDVFSVKLLKSAYLPYILWFIFSIFSATHVGGTIENLNTGLIVFLPIVIIEVLNFINKLQDRFFINASVVSFLFLMNIFQIGKSIKTGQDNFNLYKSINTYITNTQFKNPILYDGGMYTVLRDNNINPTTDLNCVNHYSNSRKVLFFENLIKKKYFKYLALSNKLDLNNKTEKLILLNYSLKKEFSNKYYHYYFYE